MANITAAMIKELRETTGAGMMDCKKALTEANGDMQAAIDAMRKKGMLKAAKKATRVAAEGIVVCKRDGDRAYLVEVNSETDFAAKSEQFLAFADQAAEIACKNDISDIEALRNADFGGQTGSEALTALVAKIGENLQLRRVMKLEGNPLGVYIHSDKHIGVLVALKGGDEQVAKDLAMHVCAFRPDFVHPEDVSAEVVAHEREIQIEIAMKSGKPREIAEKMVNGRMAKFTGEVSLTGQAFLKDPSITVGQYLKQHGDADVVSFVRLQVGEGIEKKSEDFAAEVQAQIDASKK
ncbi:MAG: translation elongation factor Ts [Succinivibrionaceae bacterium]|nr:translation elongation factor Ts [Succinivibrionaceae bacterium]